MYEALSMMFVGSGLLAVGTMLRWLGHVEVPGETAPADDHEQVAG